MRRSILILAAAVLAILAGCTGSAQDPYEIAHRAMDAPWQRVQVDVGASIKSATTTVTLDPGTVRLVIDSAAGKGLFHLSLPAAAIGVDAGTLAQLGVSGSSIDFDAVYDGEAFYARSPLLGTIVQMLLAGSGDLPQGDLSGWLRLATKSELDALGAGSASVEASPAPVDAASIKKALNDSGVTLTFVATEKRNGADEDHVSVAVDVDKLLDSPVFDSAKRAQIEQIRAAAKEGTLKADLWADHGTGRLTELDVHLAANDASVGSADVTVTLTAPAEGVSFEAPADAIDVPALTLFGEALKLLGESIGQ